MVQHKPGERRRAVVVASVVALAVYLAVAAVSHWAVGTKPGDLSHGFLTEAPQVQGIVLGVVWVGAAVWALAQSKLISYKQGAYQLIEAVTQMRALRGLGLGFGLLIVAVLVFADIEHVLTTRLTIVGVLTALTFFGFGLPDAPAQRYVSGEAGSV